MKHYTIGSVLRSGAWGVLVGGAAGFVLGLMLAPEEGPKIRRRVAYQLGHLGGQVSTLVGQITRSQAETGASRGSDVILEDVHQKTQRIRDDIEALMRELRQERVPRKASSNSD